MALFCGLRPGEILGLTYNNFDSSTQTLNIHKQYTKDGRLPSESADPKYSCKKLEGERYRSFQIPDFVCEELVLRRKKNMCFFRAHPDKRDNDNFCISSRGKIKNPGNPKYKIKIHHGKEWTFPLSPCMISVICLSGSCLEKDCPWEEIQKLTEVLKWNLLGTS